MTSETELSVMVVDDEPGIRTALRANFLRHGWRVETASCVRDAIRTVQDREFDLVVTDIRMPDGSGMEVMRAARKASPGTAVILLTAYGSVSDAVSAMRDGALDYLTKPIPFDRLQEPPPRSCSARNNHQWRDIDATGDIICRSPAFAARNSARPCRCKHWSRCPDRSGRVGRARNCLRDSSMIQATEAGSLSSP